MRINIFFRINFSITLLFLGALTINAQTKIEKSRPNFVFVLTDDQSYGMMGCTGNNIVQTPNIDQLAKEGILFDNAHITSAICTPSRTSILLSQFERKHGVNFNSGTSVSKEAWEQSYPVLMRKAGYYTGWVGKNHAPVGEGGYESGLMEKSFDYWYAGHWHLSFYPKDKHRIFQDAQSHTQVEVVNEGMDDFLDPNERKLKGAIRFLEDRPENQPFMLSINLNLPHSNGTGSMKLKPEDDEIYKTLYRDLDIPLPPHYIAKKDIKHPKLPAELLKVENRQTSYSFVDTEAKVKERYIRQLQSMTGIDRLVGNLRKKLKDLNVDKNTVIIFTSDHGLFMGEQGLGGKALCYEKTTHVPLIIHDPALPKNRKGKRSDALVQSIDVAPTILAKAGVTIPNTFQGKDLSDLMSGKKEPLREYVFTENLWSTSFGNPRCEAVQDKEWKYIRYYKNENIPALKKIAAAKQLGLNVNTMLYGVHDTDIAVYRNFAESALEGEPPVYEELYYLKKDPSELNNLVDQSTHSAILNKLRKVWKTEIQKARGEGPPKVERYTVDSKVSKKKTKTAKINTPPNIIYIMADDHTTQGFGVYGSRLAKLNPTPNIDRLAKEGMLFENAFCTNSICTPSRATIMTGQYGHVNGVYDLDGVLKKENQHLALEMKALGYQTAMVGKWHLKYSPDAFDYYNVLPRQGLYFDPLLYNSEEIGEKKKVKFGKNLEREVYTNTYKGHSSDVITDISLDWLKTKRKKDQPFFLMHHFKAPHDFFKFAPRYKDYLEDVEIPEPASMWYNANNGSVATRGYNDSLLDTIGSSIGHRNIIRNMGMHMEIDPSIPDPAYKKLAYQEYLKRYLRCVKGVDDNVKRLFDYLEAEGLMDNTIIIYTGDQGFMLGEHDYIDKRWMYEESMRMPFLIRYPKMIQAGSSTDAIINNTDFAPTILDLAGGKTPDYMQGSSFKSILATGKEPDEWQQETYYRYWMHLAHRHNNPAHFGIRTKKYKLIFFYGRDYRQRTEEAQKWANSNPNYLPNFKTPPAWEFYDLTKDPKEMDNRYGNREYASIIKELKNRLKILRSKVKENDADFPEIEKIVAEHWND